MVVTQKSEHTMYRLWKMSDRDHYNLTGFDSNFLINKLFHAIFKHFSKQKLVA